VSQLADDAEALARAITDMHARARALTDVARMAAQTGDLGPRRRLGQLPDPPELPGPSAYQSGPRGRRGRRPGPRRGSDTGHHQPVLPCPGAY
jgi:hypothetical protein